MSAAKWKEAWPKLSKAVRNEALEKFGPFPSLYANDYMHTLKSKGVDAETMKFIKALMRELSWAYDNWSRSALSPDELLKDLAAGVGQLTPGANEFNQIIRQYRQSHNIADEYMQDLSERLQDAGDWMNAVAPTLPEQTPPK